MSARSVLFLQKRSQRAGAQTCLARLMREPLIRKWNPILISGGEGWLTEECRSHGIPVIVETFPNSRSLPALLYGNKSFARRISQRLKKDSIAPAIIHANDHQEALLGLALAKVTGAAKALFLRSPEMTERDYQKYRCDDYSMIAAVGDEFCERAQGWTKRRKVQLIHDGLSEEDFAPLKPKPAGAPDRILVIGSPLKWKGWADLIDALCLLEQDGSIPPMKFDFTGTEPSRESNDLGLSRLRTTRCEFLGRVNGFRELVRSYDLVINPTRMETFGMAAAEVLAAGVPLLSTRTGIIEQILKAEQMLFPPHKPDATAEATRNVLTNWSSTDFGIEGARENIRNKFMASRAAALLNAQYEALGVN